MANTLSAALRSSVLEPLEARMLMQQVTGLSRVQLLTHDTDVLTDAQYEQWQALQARRSAGEPMAYILGEREFYGRSFKVTPDVLIPRPDTETLIDAVLARHNAHNNAYKDERPLRLLDLGTGSGAIALTLAAERPSWQVCASDVSAAALAVARENATRLGVSVRMLEGDWWQALPSAEALEFDVVVSNPPYIEADDEHLSQGDVRFEPQGALTDGADGLRHYRAILDGVARYLRPQGAVYFEHGYNQGAALRELLHAAGLVQVQTLRDLAGNERVSMGILELKG